MTVGLYMLRAKQLHLTMDDMGQLDIGDIFDMFTEMANDNYKYPFKATQADFNALFK